MRDETTHVGNHPDRGTQVPPSDFEEGKPHFMTHSETRRTVLFISSGNAVRSPMAEGFLNALPSNRYRAASAGTDPVAIDPMTVEVMKEVGIDLSSHQSLRAGSIADTPVDFVVTLCERAIKVCPLFAHGSISFHKAFPEPQTLPEEREARLEALREMRDEIRTWVETTFG